MTGEMMNRKNLWRRCEIRYLDDLLDDQQLFVVPEVASDRNVQSSSLAVEFVTAISSTGGRNSLDTNGYW